MSDTEGGMPSEDTITQKLRDVVIAIHKTAKPEDLTVKRVRVRAEKELSLPDGFLKKDSVWKQKSQDIIRDAAEQYSEDEPAPEKALTPEPRPKPAKKAAKKKTEPAKGTKRKAAPPAKKAKKRRKTDSDDDDIDGDSDAVLSETSSSRHAFSEVDSEVESKPPKKLVRRGKKVVSDDSDEEAAPKKPTTKTKRPVVEDESEDEPTATPVKKPAATPPPETKGDVSESELSSLIDETPKKKEPAAKAKKGAKPAAPKAKAAKPKADEDPDTAEVKRLQGWLVKCGIRKVWSRDPELSKCDTDKEKIRVLKSMLKDVGMDGKYSVEKAAKIKEKREFQKDLAAIQEAEAHWGTAGDNAGGRPKRRAAAAAAVKPQQKIQFSDDDEEDEDGGDQQDDESSDDGDDDDDDDDDIKGDSEDDKGDSVDDDSE